MKSVVFPVVLFFFGLMNAQDTLEKPTPLATLFDSIYTISNSYDRYKIIKKVYFQDLKRNSNNISLVFYFHFSIKHHHNDR